MRAPTREALCLDTVYGASTGLRLSSKEECTEDVR